MDPRTAATVTAPDLLGAFEEGTGGAGQREDSPERLYVFFVLGHTDVGPVAHGVFKLVDIDKALDVVRVHLEHGYKHGAAVAVGTEPPKFYEDAASSESVSQIDA